MPPLVDARESPEQNRLKGDQMIDSDRPEISSAWLDVFKGVMDNLVEGVYVIDTEKRIVYWNEAAAKITGYLRTQVLGGRCGHAMLGHTDIRGVPLCDGQCPMEMALGGRRTEVEVMVFNSAGEPIPVLMETMPVRNAHGRIVGAAQVFRDHSRFHETAERLIQMKHAAMEDPVTHVGNRRRIQGVLEARLREFDRYGMQVGIIFADINDFKRINDTWGHETGDRVLEAVARVFRQTIRRVDTLGRWGGDEFVCVIPHAVCDEIESMADRLRMNVRRLVITLDDKSRFRPSLSVGTAVVRPGDTPETLVGRADLAMYEHKRQVKAACRPMVGGIVNKRTGN